MIFFSCGISNTVLQFSLCIHYAYKQRVLFYCCVFIYGENSSSTAFYFTVAHQKGLTTRITITEFPKSVQRDRSLLYTAFQIHKHFVQHPFFQKNFVKLRSNRGNRLEVYEVYSSSIYIPLQSGTRDCSTARKL